jgi:external thioesterase TEII
VTMKLFAFPYAGGNQYVFNEYKKYLSSDIEFKVIEPAGRGLRIREPLMSDMKNIIDDIYSKIENDLNQPFAFYGHSMGGTIATLLTHKLIAFKKPLPFHIFVTGHGSPRFDDPSKPEKTFSKMTDEEFKIELRLLGGCPDEVLNNEELFNFFFPILKADFSAIENFQADYKNPHDIPLTVIIGDEEENITDLELEAWNQESTSNVSLSKFPGNHFFIYNHVERLCESLNEVLLNKTKKNHKLSQINL